MFSSLTCLLAALALTNATDLASSLLGTEADCRFRIRGTVVFASPQNNYPIAIRDGSGYVLLRDEGRRFNIMPGDEVAVGGTTTVNESGCPVAVIESCLTITRNPPPGPTVFSLADIKGGRGDNRFVRVKGTIAEVLRDEIAPHWTYLLLTEDGLSVYVTVRQDAVKFHALAKLSGASVSISGICLPRETGLRKVLGRTIQIFEPKDIEIVQAPPADPFEVPLLDFTPVQNPESILAFTRRRVIGTVIALWNDQNALLQTDSGHILRLELTHAERPPLNTRIEVVGKPETDLYRINLSAALWRPTSGAPLPVARTQPCSIRRILGDSLDAGRIDPSFHGRTIALTGIVQSVSTDNESPFVLLYCPPHAIPVDIGSVPDAFADIQAGCRVELSGVCIIETDNWHPYGAFPRTRGIRLVLRQPSDIRILARPAWWTPMRLLIVIGSLLAALIGFFIWNRVLNRLVERRSRQLFREQVAHAGDRLKVGERTRLAVELHDSLSQTLTGVSFQIDAAEQARQKDPPQVKRYLDVARQTLKSCREELRNCIWDLRNNALEEEDAEVAIRRTVEPQIGDAELSVAFSVPRKKLTDNTFHAILRIVRELAVNGVRHGNAAHIAIHGQIKGNRLAFSVQDDGCGFNPDNRPGSDEGHFGLLGVQERVEELDGVLTVDSAPGRGTLAAIELKL